MNANRKMCPKCFFASDTESMCPALTCRGTEMEPAPEALLDSEIFTPEAYQVQMIAERRLFGRNFPDRFTPRAIPGFRGAPEKKERQSSALHALHQPEEPTNFELDREAASSLREWKEK